MPLSGTLDSRSGIFARSNEPCVDGMKDIRRVLAHERMEFVPDTYGECRDSERPEALNLSAWLIATKAMRGRDERHTPPSRIRHKDLRKKNYTYFI